MPNPTAPKRRRVLRRALASLAVIASLGALAVGAWLRPWSHRGSDSSADPRIGHWGAVVRGRMLLDKGRPDLALEAVAQVRDEAPGAGEAMCVAGVALAQMQQFRPAKLALTRALRLQPRQPMAAKVLAAIHLSMGDSAQGLEALKQAAALSPKDDQPWLAMGKVHLDLGNPAEAASAYAQALKRAPRKSEAQVGRVEALLSLGRAEEAGPMVQEALQLDPNNAKLLGLAARQARDTGRADECLALADRALKIDPDEAEALLARARTHLAAGQPERALPDLERVVQVNPNHLAALSLLIQTQSRLGMKDKAAESTIRRQRANDRLALMDALTKEINSRPDDPEPRWKLGQAALDGGQPVLARNCFQAALAVQPDYPPARASLAAMGGEPAQP